MAGLHYAVVLFISCNFLRKEWFDFSNAFEYHEYTKESPEFSAAFGFLCHIKIQNCHRICVFRKSRTLRRNARFPV